MLPTPNFSPWPHPQAHPTLGLGGAQPPAGICWRERTSPGSTGAHSQPGISSQGGGEERKEAWTVQTGHWFAGKGRRILGGCWKEGNSCGVTLCLLVEKSGSCRAPQTPISQQGCPAALPPKYLPPQYPLMSLSSLIRGSPHLLTVLFKLSLEHSSLSLPRDAQL